MMLKKLLFLFCLLALFFAAVEGQSNYKDAYIKKYKKLAISEMERSGVPASIKLAQGILESDAGKSTLARKAKNHFGMKCGNNWKGKTYALEDDDYDENGQLIKSCFRVYKNVKASFIAHSEFLRDPNKRYRYGFLFQLDPTDYKAWAYGLKKAGYATSPTYAEKLINVVENYKLYQYDSPGSTIPPDQPNTGDQILTAKRVIKVNGVDVVLADGKQTIVDISLNQGVSVKRVLKYNEKINQQLAIPQKDSRVFLKKKRDGYRGKDRKYHVVKAGETLFDISQLYGVKLSKLQKRNKLEPGEEPAVGERIKLRSWFKVKNKPALRDVSEDPDPEVADEDDTDFMDESEVPDFEEPEEFDTLQEELFNEEDLEEATTPTGPVYHTVEKGESLYGIARRYGTTVGHIKNLNKLAVDIITVGQSLRIK